MCAQPCINEVTVTVLALCWRVCTSCFVNTRLTERPMPFESWRRDGGDALMLARQLTCTTKASIQSLFEFLKPPPMTVHLVLAHSSGCKAAEQLLPPGKLRCYDEARVLPIAARTVAQRYEEMPGSPRLPATHRVARRRLRDPTRLGWYFQQFVKLGFPLFNAISTDFLVWDSDAVLIAPFEPVGKDGQLRIVTGGYSNMPQATPVSDTRPTHARHTPDARPRAIVDAVRAELQHANPSP